jgi:hypothetical protein
MLKKPPPTGAEKMLTRRDEDRAAAFAVFELNHAVGREQGSGLIGPLAPLSHFGGGCGRVASEVYHLSSVLTTIDTKTISPSHLATRFVLAGGGGGGSGVSHFGPQSSP